MSIEEFMRGFFDVGIGVVVELEKNGNWRVTLYRDSPYSAYSGEYGGYRHGTGDTWEVARDAVLSALADVPWRQPGPQPEDPS